MKTMNQTTSFGKTRLTGFSLIELMVALVLGLLLLGGVLQLFAGSKATYSANESMARVQENARFALNELQVESRGAMPFGFCGTRPIAEQRLDVTPGWQQAVFGAEESLMGWEFDDTGVGDVVTVDAGYPTAGLGSWVANPRQLDGTAPEVNLPALFSASATVRPVRDSDIFVVRNLTPVPGVTADGSTIPTDNELGLDGNHGLADGDLVLVTDCRGADLFRNRSTGDQLSRAPGGACGDCPGNVAATRWEVNLIPSVQVYRVQIWAYFVGFNTDRDEPGLYRMDLSSCPCGGVEEIVEGVENMQVLYGYSLPAPDGSGQEVEQENWLRADQIEDWWPVISARVSFLQRSTELAGTGPVQRNFGLGQTTVRSPEDARLRHDATTTLMFRNRVIVDD